MKGKSINTLTKERELFGKCKRNGKYGSLNTGDFDPTESDPIKAAGVTILVIGLVLAKFIHTYISQEMISLFHS